MANPMDAISVGCLRQIFAGESVQNPVLQCVQIKPMGNTQSGAERFRVVLNDTVNFVQCMIAQQSNHIVTEGKLKKGSLIKLSPSGYQANSVKEKPILVILELDILEEYGACEKLGQPVSLEILKGEQEEAKAQPGNIASNGFYGNKETQPPKQESQRTLPSRSNGASDPSKGNITPIEALSPYSHRWTIKARVTNKGPIKEWHNKNGEGKLFSLSLIDGSGEIRATGFTDSVDQWYEVLQEGSVYYISAPCRVQLAKRQFSNVNNDYELTFERDTMIEKAEDSEGVPQVKFNFTNLADLQSVEKDTVIDAIGILQNVSEVSEIVGKASSKPYSKRELTIADTSGFSVRLTVWGNNAQTFSVEPDSVLAFKGVKVSDFGGRSLSLLSSGTMAVNPDIDDAHKLKGWYDAAGKDQNFSTHQAAMGGTTGTSGGRQDALKTIAQVRDENIGMGEEAEYFSLRATIVYVKQDSFAYPACLSEGCSKKVIEEEPGSWHCAKCATNHSRPEYRYVMSLNVSDFTGMLWLSCFDDVGKMVMGISANEVMAAKEEGDDQKANKLFQEANCRTYVFRVRAKMDTFQDQQRVRYQIMSAAPISWASEAKKLADLIKQYDINGSDGLFVN